MPNPAKSKPIKGEERGRAHDRNLLKISVISLTPNFSWVLMAAKARGTVSTVSRFIFP
jgi:hypothetical protein